METTAENKVVTVNQVGQIFSTETLESNDIGNSPVNLRQLKIAADELLLKISTDLDEINGTNLEMPSYLKDIEASLQSINNINYGDITTNIELINEIKTNLGQILTSHSVDISNKTFSDYIDELKKIIN